MCSRSHCGAVAEQESSASCPECQSPHPSVPSLPFQLHLFACYVEVVKGFARWYQKFMAVLGQKWSLLEQVHEMVLLFLLSPTFSKVL